MSNTATRAPRAAKACAVARPRPEPPPLTIAATPWMFMVDAPVCLIPHYCSCESGQAGPAQAPSPSWPGLSRPSTPERDAPYPVDWLTPRGVDGRDKPGHD